MIWAILVFLGIPLWLIAVALFMLMRTRSRIGSIPGSVRCKARSSAPIPGLKPDFARFMSTAHWVHDVLILHNGTFLIQTLPLGIREPASAPQPIEPSRQLRKFADPVVTTLTHDSGAVIEVVCAKADVGRLFPVR